MPARVGVVGAGWWATTVHLPALRGNPDADVVGICDTDSDRAARVARDFDVPHAVSSMTELLDLQLDAVLVATPHDAHHAPAAAALDAGVDVCVEKPMTINGAQAWDLVDRARRGGANLHVGYTFPHAAEAARLRDRIRAGGLGNLLCVSSLFATSIVHLYRDPGSPYAHPDHGGQLLTQATHAVSLIIWLTGGTAVSVSALTASEPGSAVDVADTLVLQLGGGAIVSVCTTGSLASQDDRFEEYRFFGTTDHAVLDTRRDLINPLEAPSAALVATALGRAPGVVSGELGAHTVDILGAARASATSRQPVSIPSPQLG